MSNSNQFTRWGAVARELPFTFGKVFYVSESADSWTSDLLNEFPNDQDGTVRVYTDVLSAYNATVAGRNDVIVLDSNSVHTLAAMITVSKDRVHFVSTDYLAGIRRVQDQRCRVNLPVTAVVTDVATVRVTGNGCSFRGIKFTNSNTLTQSVTVFQDESQNGLVVENCSIHAIGSAQLTATGGSALRLAGDGSTYRACQIGSDTILNTVANQVVNVATINGSVARRSIFEDCYFYTYSSASTHVFVRTQAATDVDRYVIFKRCVFSNFATGGGTTLAVGIASNVTSGYINVDSGCSFFGVTKVASAAVGNSNVGITAPVPTAATSGLAVTPA